MAAEDWIPDCSFEGDFWHTNTEEDDSPHILSRRPRPTYCNRCNAGPFTWKYTGKGWRLHDSQGQVHTCAPTTYHPQPSATAILSTTTQAFTGFPPKESPIMDKNAVAFIRNDVRSILVAFIDSEKGSSEEYTQESLRQRAMPYQKYTYLTIDPNIQPGDWVVVSVRGIIKTAYVVSVSSELTIEPNAPVTYRFIVGRVDLIPYQSLLDQNAKIDEMLRTSYQATIREGFRQTLLNGLPADQRDSISLLLSSKV